MQGKEGATASSSIQKGLSERTSSGEAAAAGTLQILLVHGWMRGNGITMQKIFAALVKTAPTTLRSFGEQPLKLDVRPSNVRVLTRLSHAITILLATMLAPDHTETWHPPFSIHSPSWITIFPLHCFHSFRVTTILIFFHSIIFHILDVIARNLVEIVLIHDFWM